ncbi:hypothetical protein ACFPVS_12010 [Neisseria weixii]|uniref:hypothetical protein n=1 Tax=Neisseria weixii TaxID=1853276 RepID=UPI000BB99E45|nr:hypothetical protein [Neisseria weixii]ATD64877.1 hypothetical protein CGZ65_05310 [Neisseria weixii]
MAKKVYIAETALILQNEDGEDFRVEPGETVELTADQYQDVAAHVVVAEISDEVAQPDSETPPEVTPSETEPQSETKPARGRGSKKEA